MNTKDFYYSWHLSLRVDRPLEGCPMRPHAYMYGKKLDDSRGGSGASSAGAADYNATSSIGSNASAGFLGSAAAAAAGGDTASLGSNNSNGGNGTTANNGASKASALQQQLGPHTKRMKEPPPQHEFSYRWFRGPLHEACAYEGCRRRTSFSPHDWSKHAIGGTECAIQCVSTQSSLYKCTFCNPECFVSAWKTQYTVPKEYQQQMHLSQNHHPQLQHQHSGPMGNSNSRGGTPVRSRSASFGGSDEEGMFDEVGSTRSSGSKSPSNMIYGNPYEANNHHHLAHMGSNPGTPRGYLGGYNQMGAPPPPPPPQHFGTGGATGSGPAFAGDFHSIASGTGGNDDWIEISRDHIFVPGPEDVGRKLKIEAAAYSIETGELLMSRVVKTDVVLGRAPDPVKRNLVTVKNASSNSAAGSGGPRFRVATYNVLAEIYATQQQYPYCDFWALNWDYRFQNIMREIMDAAPDVVCLQEIQADHYENHVYAAMSDSGFEGVYKQKTRQSMGLAGKVDGCALFWKRSKFHLSESYSIEFNEVAQRQATQVLGLNPRSEEGAAFLNRLSKDNVAQLVVLEFIQNTGRPNREINQVCIANTHLYSNKDFPDVKLWQTWQLLQELESFILSRGTNLPLIICGDFNSTPDTAVYNLLARQQVHPGHPDVNVATGDDVPNILPDPMNITHSFQLGSCYQSVLGEEPWVTNYTLNFKGVLDYIWYSAQNLRPLSAAPIPDEEQLTRHGEALPSTEYSSDHVMLISDLQIITNGGR